MFEYPGLCAGHAKPRGWDRVGSGQTDLARPVILLKPPDLTRPDPTREVLRPPGPTQRVGSGHRPVKNNVQTSTSTSSYYSEIQACNLFKLPLQPLQRLLLRLQDLTALQGIEAKADSATSLLEATRSERDRAREGGRETDREIGGERNTERLRGKLMPGI